jgi:hypothetical protein
MLKMIVAMVKLVKMGNVSAKKDLSAHLKVVGILMNVKAVMFAHPAWFVPTNLVPLNVSAHLVQWEMPKLVVPSPINVSMMPSVQIT